MTHRNRPPQCVAQRGYAMLVIIALIGVAATAAIITSLSATAVRNEQSRKTSSALALAKQALIASAASSNTRPGSLPCPDTNNDGQSDVSAGIGECLAVVGRLPWLTLGLPDLRDAGNERLWYALSPQFSDSLVNVINSGTLGSLNVTGTIAANNVVAIVFAPGAPVGTQTRGIGQVNAVSQYVESYVSPNSYSTQSAGNTYNDQLITVSAADIFQVVDRRVAKEVQNALQMYAANTGGRLPWYAPACATGVTGSSSCPAVNPLPALPSPGQALPAAGATGYLPTDDSSLVLPGWFGSNKWNSVITYRVDSDCAAGLAATCGQALAGYTVSTTSGVLIGFSGGTANAGSKALVSFSGVSPLYDNYQATQLGVAVQ